MGLVFFFLLVFPTRAAINVGDTHQTMEHGQMIMSLIWRDKVPWPGTHEQGGGKGRGAERDGYSRCRTERARWVLNLELWEKEGQEISSISESSYVHGLLGHHAPLEAGQGPFDLLPLLLLVLWYEHHALGDGLELGLPGDTGVVTSAFAVMQLQYGLRWYSVRFSVKAKSPK